MLDKIKAIFAVFQAGKSVSDPTAWKGRQITVNMLVALIVAVAHLSKVLGYDLQLDTETINGIAVGVLAIVNWLLTLSTSKKVGFGEQPNFPQIERRAERANPTEVVIEDHSINRE